MAFIKIFFLLLKIFEKIEKTGIISTKFSLRCTPSVILGLYPYIETLITHNAILIKMLQSSLLSPLDKAIKSAL